MQGQRPLFLLLSRLAPKQASASRLRRRNSLRASGLHHSKKTMKTGWRGPLSYKKLRTFKLTKLTSGLCPLRAADLPGSGPPMRKSVFKVWVATACFHGLGRLSVFMVWVAIACLHGLGR